MYKATHITIPRNIQAIYKTLMYLYPQEYRIKFESEMLLLVQDMYQEEIAAKGKISIMFWMGLVLDMIKSTTQQHQDFLMKHGLRKYVKETFNVTSYSVVGLFLVLPFLTFLAIDCLVILLTGSRAALQPLHESIFMKLPLLPIWLLGFPVLAIFLNLIPLTQEIRKTHMKMFHMGFIFPNIVTISIIAIGLFAVVLTFGHDVIPCIVKQTFIKGLFQFPQIISICKNV